MILIIRMVWFLYFAYISFIYFSSIPGEFALSSETLDFLITFPSIAALFSLIFRVKILSPTAWQLYFCTILAWDFYYHFFIKQFSAQFSQETLIFFITLIPLYIAIAILAFIKKN